MALSKITAGAITAYAGGNAQTAINSADTAVKNNYLSQRQKAQREVELNNCKDIGYKASMYAKWAAIDAGQDGSFAAGLAMGVPAGLYDTVIGLAHMGMNPLETWEALKGVINSGDILGTVSSAVKQSYLDRIDHMMAEYERAGAGGAFNAGVEGGKLVADLASLVAGGWGTAKGGGILIEKVAAKVVVPNNTARTYAHNMIENPGPLASLPNNPAANFAGGKYNTITLKDDLILYRAGQGGGGRNALGQWFTREPASSVAQVRIDLAVKPHWTDANGALTGTSPIESIYQIKIPKGTTIYEGPVGSQGGVYLGGQNVMQIYVNQPWNIKGVQIMNVSPIGRN
ncbi:VENN motif pre-toxin domain-containing protein [Zobellella sp. DQSA1]|uniref:VENN motif pre-toxin domain-containing protein n=1 Tax=Zobellella sp. DQSA1 TaxID=3342386 RepID=UPI0035C0BA51